MFSQTTRRAERFGCGEWQTLATGAPTLYSALAAFDCEIVQRLPYETHTIFLGLVKDVHLPKRDTDPLLYVDGGIRRFGSEASPEGDAKGTMTDGAGLPA